jgi:hypothetical protein
MHASTKRLIVFYAFKTFGFNKLKGAYCSFLKSSILTTLRETMHAQSA